MTIKKFVVSAADVYGYDPQNGNLMFVGKTLLDTSVETTLANTDVRSGRGNALQYIYYHTAEMNISVSDAQWNLDFLAANVGSTVTTGADIYTEESVTLGSNKGGSVTGTPVTTPFSAVYGWVTLTDGTVEKVTFSTKAFVTSGGAEGDVVCVRYLAHDNAARSITIRSDMVPSIMHLVMEAQLCSSDVSTNVIGKVIIEVPRAQMSGAFTLSLTPDSVSSTPLKVRALKTELTGQGCGNLPVYATIKEQVTNSTWYDSVHSIGFDGGDFQLATTTGTKQLKIWAIPSNGYAFLAPITSDDITLTSSDETKATVSATGLVTGVAAGTATIHATIKNKTSVDAAITVTVPA